MSIHPTLDVILAFTYLGKISLLQQQTAAEALHIKEETLDAQEDNIEDHQNSELDAKILKSCQLVNDVEYFEHDLKRDVSDDKSCSSEMNNRKVYDHFYTADVLHQQNDDITDDVENPFDFDTDESNLAFTRQTAAKQQKKLQITNKPFKCKTCGKAFASKRSLMYHNKYEKYKKKPREETFSQILKTEPGKPDKVYVENKIYKCGICDKTFTDKSTLEIHGWVHPGQEINSHPKKKQKLVESNENKETGVLETKIEVKAECIDDQTGDTEPFTLVNCEKSIQQEIKEEDNVNTKVEIKEEVVDNNDSDIVDPLFML